MSVKTIDLSKNKIKYLAIGDSIAEGFNPVYRFGLPGEMKTQLSGVKKITGMCYPSYIASLFNNINPNSLDSFENFSITGTRVVDWLYFLKVDPKIYNYKNSIAQIKSAKDVDNHKDNPFRKRINKQFGGFGLKSDTDFDKLKTKIKSANLITITIGANDLLTQIPIFELISWKNNKMTKENLDLFIDKIYTKLLNQMKLLFATLRKLNSEANIIATSYPSTFPIFFNLIDDKFIGNKEYENGFLSYFIDKLNLLIKNASSENNIKYINIENKEYWKSNISKLSKVFFEIHPTSNGYKKIAHEIFSSISLSNNFYSKSTEEINNLFPNWINNFSNNNLSNIIDYSKIVSTDEELIKLSKIENKKLFWQEDSSQKQYLHLKKNISFKNYVVGEVNNDSENIRSLLKTILVFISVNKLTSSNEMKKLIENKEYFYLLIKSCIKSKYFDIVANQVSEEVFEMYNYNPVVSSNDLVKIIIKNSFNIGNLLVLFRDLGVEFTKLNNPEFLELVKHSIISSVSAFFNNEKYMIVAKEFIRETILNKTFKNSVEIETNLLEILTDYFIDSKKFNSFILGLIESYFSSIVYLKNLRSDEIFLEKYTKDFFKKINIISILKDLLEEQNIHEVICQMIFSSLKIEKANNDENEIIKNAITLLILKIDDKEFLIKIFSKFIVNLISTNKKSSLVILSELTFGFKKNEFWDMVGDLKLRKLWTNKSDVFVLADIINLLFEKSKKNGPLYKKIMNINSNVKNEKISSSSILNIWKDLIVKINKIERLYIVIINTLYNSYLEFKKLNPLVENKDNPYYKACYRFIVTSLWIGYRMFQKDIHINIFWSTKKGISQSLPSIATQLYRLSMNNNFTDFTRRKLVDDIFGDIGFVENHYNPEKEKETLRKSLLWCIKNSDKFPKNGGSEEPKKDVIFESLYKGYWDN
ncbi:MAG: hypothetical protein KFW07_00170 [Mycoplasmataceae bacterium]|nr:hypothetical protein [Mycoplasmataceae bacterium]